MSNYVIFLCMFIIKLDYAWFTGYSHDSIANSLLTCFGSYTGLCLIGVGLLMFCSGHEDLAIELTSTYEVGSKSQTETRKEDKHWGLVDVLFYCFKVLKSCKIRYDKCRSRGFQYRQVASEQEV